MTLSYSSATNIAVAMVQSIRIPPPKLDFSAFAQSADDNLPKENSSPFKPLIEAAVANPANIDSLLPPYLALDTTQPSVTPAAKVMGHSTLASHLSELLEPNISQSTTPPIFWVAPASMEFSPGTNPHLYSWDPLEWFTPLYWNSLRADATLLGRALTLAHSLYFTDADPDSTSKYEKRFTELWGVAESIFLKALFSFRHQEPAARYAAGVLILTCSAALRDHNGGVKSKGKGWSCWCKYLQEPEVKWGWKDIEQAIQKTEQSVPQNNTDFSAVVRLRDEQNEGPNRLEWASENQPPEYVPKEVVSILQSAREHLSPHPFSSGRRDDWTSKEMMRLATEGNPLNQLAN